MFEAIFLFFLGLIWVVFATSQDLKTKEVSNWLNFSLLFFALGFRFFYSLFFAGNFSFFFQGILGFAILLILGNLLYFGRMFAGGDAKLLISLGALLPLSNSFSANLGNFVLFFVVFLIVAAVYTLIFSFGLSIKHRKKFGKEFNKQFHSNKNRVNLSLFISIFFLALGVFVNFVFIFLGLFFFVLPYLYIYAKSVDEVAMVKTVSPKGLREGDWLYNDVTLGNRKIRATWEGLSKNEISILRKKQKKVKIREGIAFTPVFLISYIVFFYLWGKGLGYSFW